MAKMPKQKPGESKQDYATPPAFIAAAKRKLGIERFEVDLAADKDNAVAMFIDERQNSLSLSWWDGLPKGYDRAGWFWLNPPFADIAPWVKKCWEESQRGCRIALLIPASVGADWYVEWVHGKAEAVLFLNGRLRFMPDKPKWLYPKDCILALYTPNGGGDTFYDVWNWREEP